MLKHGSQGERVRRCVKFLLAFIFATAMCALARAEEPMPEGMKGWWYYIGLHKSGVARSPHEACALSAGNTGAPGSNTCRRWRTPHRFSDAST